MRTQRFVRGMGMALTAALLLAGSLAAQME